MNMKTAEVCANEQRRSDVRESPLFGLDYLEVDDKDQHILTVYFLGAAPPDFGPDNITNVRIEGGRRVMGIKVVGLEVQRTGDEELDDSMTITVDKVGDFSTYTLRVVDFIGFDENRQPLYRSFRDFDDRYDSVEFSFRVNCASDLDCATDNSCPPAVYETPEISYLAKDYASFRQLMLDRLALTIPGWQERHIPDIGIAVVEVLAYVGDYLSYYQDAVATEAYLGTARQRISVRRHARLVDYDMHEGCNARTWVYLQVQSSQGSSDTENTPSPIILNSEQIYFITEPNGASGVNGTMLLDRDVQLLASGDYEAFEPLFEGGPAYVPQSLSFYPNHNEIRFYTWGDEECCLPRGATSATLQDYAFDANASPDAEEELTIQNKSDVAQALAEDQDKTLSNKGRILSQLAVGDFLLFEEVRGSKTGLASDALMSRRHVVRLTRVTPGRDYLYGKKVLEIEWGQEDALPFPLCISSIGQAPDCRLLKNISVARGNLLLVDHGLGVIPKDDVQTVQVAMSIPHCEGEDQASDVELLAAPFPFVLSKFPVTFSQRLVIGGPAAQVLTQDVRQARANVCLMSTLPMAGSKAVTETQWLAQQDLLESEPEDAHFVVEIDNDGHAHLRFGNGDTGRAPTPNEVFTPKYRMGNGPMGNVGAEMITHIVFRDKLPPDGTLTPRNPFAAVGGTLPEPIAEVKQFAPYAFRSKLERAITADDYVQVLKDYPGVQRTAATLRWNGSGYDVLIAIDPFGSEMLSDSLRTSITLYLDQFRRIGHDIAVEQAHYVPIALKFCVVVQAHYLRGHVKADVLKRLGNGVLPDGSKGFFHPDNLSFGGNIAVSVLVALVQAVPGVQYVEVLQLERFGEGPNQELAKGVLEIGPLEIAQLDNDANFPEHGTLTLDMKGGR